MVLIVLAYVGGILTILSPCILPVLPFVFSRAGEPFLRAGLPLLVGMAAAFTGVATLAAVGGGWVVAANQYGRLAALALFALFALTLLSETLAENLNRPLVTLGAPAVSGGAGQRRARRAVGLGHPRRGNRPAMGTLRRANPWPDPHRRRAQWRERHDLAATVCLCSRRSHLAGAGAICRRARRRASEAIARRWRVGASWPWRRRTCGRCSGGHRPGRRFVVAHRLCEYGDDRGEAARYHTRPPRRGQCRAGAAEHVLDDRRGRRRAPNSSRRPLRRPCNQPPRRMWRCRSPPQDQACPSRARCRASPAPSNG